MSEARSSVDYDGGYSEVIYRYRKAVGAAMVYEPMFNNYVVANVYGGPT